MSWQCFYMGGGQNRFIVLSTQNTEFILILLLILFFPPENMFIDLRETQMWKRNIGCLHMCPDQVLNPKSMYMTLIENQTCELLVYGMMQQLTEPHGQGIIYSCIIYFSIWTAVNLLISTMYKPEYIQAVDPEKESSSYF